MFLRLEINEKTKKKTIQNWLLREAIINVEEEIAYHEIELPRYQASQNLSDSSAFSTRRREKVNSSPLNSEIFW